MKVIILSIKGDVVGAVVQDEEGNIEKALVMKGKEIKVGYRYNQAEIGPEGEVDKKVEMLKGFGMIELDAEKLQGLKGKTVPRYDQGDRISN